MTGQLDADAFADAAARLRSVGDKTIGQAAELVVDDMAGAVLANVRRRRGRHRVTGKGERLVTVKATGSGDGRVARVHAGGRIAHLIIGGTRAHPIRPIRARALAFVGPARGFAASVRHPGTRPDPFVARGVDDSRAEVATITDTAGDELAAELAHDIGRR